MVAARVAFATATTALLSGVEYLRPLIGEALLYVHTYIRLPFRETRNVPFHAVRPFFGVVVHLTHVHVVVHLTYVREKEIMTTDSRTASASRQTLVM